MSQAMRFEEILRRLAVVDQGFAGDQAGLVLGPPAVWGLDPRTAALVRVGVLAAIGAPEACQQWSAVPGVAGAFGYDIEAALEDPDGT